MSTFATVKDVIEIFRPLSNDEVARTEKLLPLVADSLRQEALLRNKNLDSMIEKGEVLATVVKSVVVDVIARTLMTSTNQEPAIQSSQSAMGYSVSSTHLVPGGGLFIKKSELSRIGIIRGGMRVIEYDFKN